MKFHTQKRFEPLEIFLMNDQPLLARIVVQDVKKLQASITLMQNDLFSDV